ncbi:MAG: hypothetical protein AAF645_11110, partial [Myxococcota bacterium]
IRGNQRQALVGFGALAQLFDANFEGFETPQNPDLTVALDSMRIDAAVKFIVEELGKRSESN